MNAPKNYRLVIDRNNLRLQCRALDELIRHVPLPARFKAALEGVLGLLNEILDQYENVSLYYERVDDTLYPTRHNPWERTPR